MAFADYDRFRGRGERGTTQCCRPDKTQFAASTSCDTHNSTHVGQTRRSSGFFCPSLVLHGLDGPHTTDTGGHCRLPGGWRGLSVVLCRSEDDAKGRDVSKATRISSSASSGPRIEVLENRYNIQYGLHVAASLVIYVTFSHSTKNTMSLRCSG